MNQNSMYHILPSGFCWRPDSRHMTKLKKEVHQIRETKLDVQRIQFNDPQFQFFIGDPNVEKILEISSLIYITWIIMKRFFWIDQQDCSFWCQSYQYSCEYISSSHQSFFNEYDMNCRNKEFLSFLVHVDVHQCPLKSSSVSEI